MVSQYYYFIICFLYYVVSFVLMTIISNQIYNANRENTVTSCKKCNAQKGSTLPNALRSVGMKLLRQPKVPTKYELAANASKMVPRRVHPSWKPFLHIDSKDGGDEDSLDEYVEMDSRKYLDGTW